MRRVTLFSVIKNCKSSSNCLSFLLFKIKITLCQLYGNFHVYSKKQFIATMQKKCKINNIQGYSIILPEACIYHNHLTLLSYI